MTPETAPLLGVAVETHTAPDGQGRQQFTARWLDGDTVRGQVFHTRLDKFIADAERRGETVRVLGGES